MSDITERRSARKIMVIRYESIYSGHENIRKFVVYASACILLMIATAAYCRETADTGMSAAAETFYSIMSLVAYIISVLVIVSRTIKNINDTSLIIRSRKDLFETYGFRDVLHAMVLDDLTPILCDDSTHAD